MVNAFLAGDPKTALKMHAKLYPLFRNLFVETNPVPCKAALALEGMMTDEVRLPLVSASQATRELMAATMMEVGL
jgi:4-hydroxy-tetrahydrodipicolinate synthase